MRATPRSALADCTRYSGRRRSNAHAKASSQWKVPLCVPIRGGAMRLLRGRLKGGTDSRLSLQCQIWRGGGGDRSRDRRPRRKWRPMQLPLRARGSADPENKAPAQPYFRFSAVPTATDLVRRIHSAGKAFFWLPQRFRWNLRDKHCNGLWEGTYPLDHGPPSLHRSFA